MTDAGKKNKAWNEFMSKPKKDIVNLYANAIMQRDGMRDLAANRQVTIDALIKDRDGTKSELDTIKATRVYRAITRLRRIFSKNGQKTDRNV